MKKLLFFLSMICAFNFSCSKKDQSVPEMPSNPADALYESPINLSFDGFVPTYSRSYEVVDSVDTIIIERNFYCYGFSGIKLPGDSLYLSIDVHQASVNNDSTYSIPTFTIYRAGADDYFSIQPDSIDFNFFNLAYKNDSAHFFGTCHVTEGTGRFEKITLKTAPLSFSGYMDTVHRSGNIRIKGSIYYY